MVSARLRMIACVKKSALVLRQQHQGGYTQAGIARVQRGGSILRARLPFYKGAVMANRLSRQRQIDVLRLLLEGNSIRSTSRLTSVHRDTIMRLVVRFGTNCQALLNERLTGLTLGHVQIDEMWTFCQKKQARLTLDERAERHDIGDMFLWLAIDQETKLVPSHLVGKRSADNARKLLVDLAGRLVLPSAGSADDHAYEQRGEYQPVVQISTDGLAAYPEAVDLAFGPFARYGVLIKNYRNASMQYDPSETVGADRRIIRNIQDAFSICTSHIERFNLSIRTFMKRFARLTLGFSKKLANLEAATAMQIAAYNFTWRPRRPGNTSRRFPTPAMMAGVTDRLWNFDDLYDAAMQV